MPATTPLVYLMKQLGFTSKEWIALDEKDKEDLKQYAREELDALGIEHS